MLIAKVTASRQSINFFIEISFGRSWKAWPEWYRLCTNVAGVTNGLVRFPIFYDYWSPERENRLPPMSEGFSFLAAGRSALLYIKANRRDHGGLPVKVGPSARRAWTISL